MSCTVETNEWLNAWTRWFVQTLRRCFSSRSVLHISTAREVCRLCLKRNMATKFDLFSRVTIIWSNCNVVPEFILRKIEILLSVKVNWVFLISYCFNKIFSLAIFPYLSYLWSFSSKVIIYSPLLFTVCFRINILN